MKTVLLLGAGVSRAARPRASTSNRPPLDSDFFQIARAGYRGLTDDVLDCLRFLVGEYADALSQSLETATTYLYIKAIDSSSGSPYHRGFLRLLTLLSSVLGDTTNPISMAPRGLIYRFLLSELRQVAEPKDLTVITFNYDLVLERVLESICAHGHPDVFWFPGCYRMTELSHVQQVVNEPEFETEEYEHEGVGLLKLHGSMNWQSTHTSYTPTPRALLNPDRELHVLDAVDICPDLTWQRGGRNVHMKPIIVPPVSGKRGMMHRDIISLWATAGQALQEADRVVVAGYSCPPMDLEARILLSENMRANEDKRVYVIDPNPEAAVKFFDLCGVDHVTIYTSIEKWIRDAPQ